MDQHTMLTRASIFVGFQEFLAERGCALAPLLEAAGLTSDCIADPDRDISVAAVAAVLEAAAEKTGDPCLGLHWAENYPAGASGVFGQLLIHAGTLGEAMAAIARYFSLIVVPPNIEFRHDGNLAILTWRLPPPAPSLTQYMSFGVAIAVLRLRAVAGPGWQPEYASLGVRELPCAADAHRLLGPVIHYNAPACEVAVQSALLTCGPEHSNTRLYGLMRDLGERLLAERPMTSGAVQAAQGVLLRQLEKGDVSLEAIARALDLTPRALQSRLQQSGTTFEAVLNETRAGLAERFLRDTDLPLAEIALLLGFSEQSAFTRAAARWFGVAPSAYRQQLRG